MKIFKPGDKVKFKHQQLDENETPLIGRVTETYTERNMVVVRVDWDVRKNIYEYPAIMLEHAYNGVEWMLELL